ncbi:VWA domain-containing protein [Lysobacter sp. A378]
MNIDLDALHFLRPDWLWLLLGLPLLGWWWQRRRQRASVWRDAVDPHLLAHLLAGRGGSRKPRVLLAAAGYSLAYLLAVLALAGPSWQQTAQPLWQPQTPLVIALDLSSTSLAGDLQPSRLAQARAKLAVLLDQREGGQVGLVVYAGDAFTVAPPTRDAANVALFLGALQPEVMPVDGQRGDRAIAWSARLLEQAGFRSGRILLLTNHADADALAAARAVSAQGYSVSAIGLGTAQGAPYKTATGAIASTRLEVDSLRQLAAAGGGRYVTLTPDNSDLERLGVLDPTDTGMDGAGGQSAAAEHGLSWQDGGFWLLPPLMLLALFAFRRGAPVAVIVLCLWLPGRTAQAAELWQRPDQVSHQKMEQAAQAYRQGDFDRAAELYATIDGAQADYNRGNALAKAGQYPQALEAYDKAIARQAAMPDAVANRQAVEAAMKRQPPKGPGKGKQPEDQDQKDSGQGDSGQGDSGQEPKNGSPSGSPADSGKKSKPPRQAEDGEPQDPSNDPGSPPPSPSAPPEAADAKAQQAADEAQRERMEQALGQASQKPGKPEESEASTAPASETPDQRERRIANEAWLGRVPDDPGGLLREKFRIEYQRRQLQGGSEQ